MKAILKVKGGFTKEYEVQAPPPMDIRIAEMDESPGLTNIAGKDLQLYDVVCKQRLFLLKGVASPVESEDRRLAERNRTRHYSQYGTIEPVAIYEEQEPMSEAEKKRVLDEIYARAVKDGIIKPVVDILVEEDAERFIKLDSEEKGG